MLCFTISNLKSTRTHKGWRVELSCKPLTILESANSYRNSIFFSYAMYYTFHCVFLHCISHVSLSFLLIALESMYYPSSISFLFRKRSTIGHLNVQLQQLKMKSNTSWVSYYTLHFKIVSLFFEVFFKADIHKS